MRWSIASVNGDTHYFPHCLIVSLRKLTATVLVIDRFLKISISSNIFLDILSYSIVFT